MNDQMLSCVPNQIRVEHMSLVRNLLDVKISDTQLKAASLNDGIDVEIRSEKSFTVNSYWVVKIRDIHLEIGKDWNIMRDELRNGSFLTGTNQCLSYNPPMVFEQTNGVVKVSIKPPNPIDASYLASIVPRDFYPLVVIVTCHDDGEDFQGYEVAGNIQLIHIKDETVPIRTHVIKQYSKQIDGRILDISQLFLEESLTCMICFEEADSVAAIKLLCLLPCRHSPICSDCIKRIRECPKCRCPIASVFDINAPPAMPTQQGQVNSEATRQPEPDQVLRRRKGFLDRVKKTMFGI